MNKNYNNIHTFVHIDRVLILHILAVTTALGNVSVILLYIFESHTPYVTRFTIMSNDIISFTKRFSILFFFNK